jgi:hypothetical protein
LCYYFKSLQALEKDIKMKKLNFYSSVEPMLFLTRLLGLFPYSFHFSQEKKFKFSLVWFIWSMCLMTSMLGLAMVLLNIKRTPTTLSEVWRSIITFQCCLVVFQQVFQILKGSKIGKIIQDIQNFDSIAMRNGIFMEYKRDRVEVALSECFIFVVTFYMSILVMMLVKLFGFQNYQMQLTSYYHTFFLFCHTSQFNIYCKMIKIRFRKINEYLTFVLNHHQKLDDKLIEKLFKFNRLYNILCKILQDFNEIIVANITQSLLVILLQCIFVMYEVVSMIYFEKKQSNFVALMIDKCSWFCFHIILLTTFCHSGHSLTKTALKSEELMIEKISQSKILSDVEHLHAFYVRLKLQDKTVQNIFIAINWKLILMVKIS